MVTDPIADMLTQIRNAARSGKTKVVLPASRMQIDLARVLKEEGYIAGYRAEPAGPAKRLEIELKPKREQAQPIAGLKRISRPGLRIYARKTEIPRVLGGLGIVVLSTSHGLMSGRQAQKAGLGGEVVCYVW